MVIRITDPDTLYQKRTPLKPVKKMLKNHSNKKKRQFCIIFANVLSLGIKTQTIIENAGRVYTD
jgi:hypothetical protein